MFHGDNTSAKNNGQEREKKINSDIIRRYFKEEVEFKRVSKTTKIKTYCHAGISFSSYYGVTGFQWTLPLKTTIKPDNLHEATVYRHRLTSSEIL